MPSAKLLTLVFFLSIASTVFAQQGNGDSNGLEPRVSALENRVGALEELTLQQQGEIDKNASDIAGLPSTGGGGGGGSIGWVVMDSDDKEVGTVVSIGNNLQAVVELSAGGETFLVTAQREGIQQFYQPLYYTSGDCTVDDPGDAVFTTVEIDELQNIVIFVEPGDPDSRVAYEVGGVQSSQDILSQSFGGACSPYPYSFNVLPVTPVSGDLHQVYFRPFTLVKQ
jgi:hypothetical protein